MPNLLGVALISTMLWGTLYPSATLDKQASARVISKKFQKALNIKSTKEIENLFSTENDSAFLRRYQAFSTAFPNAKWEIRIIEPLSEKRYLIEVVISNKDSSKKPAKLINSKQIGEITISKGIIIQHEIISEETIVQSGEIVLPIQVNIPQTVLTGTNYDFDIIVERPLGDSMLAGGLTPVTPDEMNNNISPKISLTPLGSGGLFKSIKAPLSEGFQNFAAQIAHPEGIITITKKVSIVSDKSQLIHN